MTDSPSHFHFAVDEDWAKQHNEVLRDTKLLVASAVALFVIFLAAGAAVWFLVDPASPWRLLGGLGLSLFGVMMLIVGLAIPRSVGTAQSVYDSATLAPAIIADTPGTRTTLLALVDSPTPALVARDVQAIPHVNAVIGAKVPVAVAAGPVITPMPIAWGTPDPGVVTRAASEISDARWRALRSAKGRLEEVRAAKNGVLPIKP
ncbi:DUF3239 domain-containing protein [Corynebacterium liangguodongii]|uniref:DUF3239 domain-containing protein n=1 Tax=Corynebacterium liangguodongii TaxID=2079535 RepID=A0A2S0WCV0_9CORY|nr:DUF3239 domain-containing protein [Corynebacterium liangguodongii]AWB83607.1 DUF3239 domain-containing protein [Corynebacterium liangguodongii]PWB99586.1 DUF3239 domain-containing protein [Corynebacterium liangguodongii]